MGTVSQNFFKLFRGPGTAAAAAPALAAEVSAPGLRRSSGLAELSRVTAGREALKVLDLGPTSARNITYLTQLGHSIYNDDVLFSSTSPVFATTTEDGRPSVNAEKFMAANLKYAGREFDAVLCWDVPDYMHESLVKPMVDRIHSVLKPGGVLLAFFHTRDAGPDAPCYRYHIQSPDSLDLQCGSKFRLQRVFNNRHIENLFREYASIKFFLARDNVREVLVVR